MFSICARVVPHGDASLGGWEWIIWGGIRKPEASEIQFGIQVSVRAELFYIHTDVITFNIGYFEELEISLWRSYYNTHKICKVIRTFCRREWWEGDGGCEV